MNIQQTDNGARFEQLFYFVFGISTNGEECEKKRKCVEKSYRDLCRTISYKKDSREKKRIFKDEVNNKILECINEYPIITTDTNSNVFDEWHESVISQIKGIAKEYEDIFDDHRLITVGQAQKWLNMTIKYMRIMGSLPERIDERFIHVPIDNFIMNAANKTGIISEGFSVNGLNVERLSCAWSKLDKYDEYINYQNAIRGKLSETEYIPIDWESSAWMAEATLKAEE